MAVNSATYLGYKIGGVAGAALSTLAVCLPSFVIIYVISLFFDQFLSLKYVACAFRGIQACVVYLIFSAGLRMIKALDKSVMNKVIVALVMAAMALSSALAVSFSSIFYILICGLIGLAVWGIRRGRGRAK